MKNKKENQRNPIENARKSKKTKENHREKKCRFKQIIETCRNLKRKTKKIKKKNTNKNIDQEPIV